MVPKAVFKKEVSENHNSSTDSNIEVNNITIRMQKIKLTPGMLYMKTQYYRTATSTSTVLNSKQVELHDCNSVVLLGP